MPKQGGPVNVMLSEHVEGRTFIKEMEKASSGTTVDTKAFAEAAQGYASLLRAHVDKENNVLFPAAEGLLASPELERAYGKLEEHEETVIGHGRHEELHAMLKEMKQKCLG